MLRRGWWIGPIAAAACALAPAAAHAGTYAVHACHTPSGATAPLDGWNPNQYIGGSPPEAEAVDECRGASRAMVLRFNAVTGSPGTWNYATGATWSYDAPEDTKIASVALAHTFSADGPTYVEWAIADDSGYRERCFLAAGGCAGAAPSVSFPSWQGGRYAQMALMCMVDPNSGANCEGPGGQVSVSRATMTLRDDIPPTPGAAAGELVDPSRPLVGMATANVPVGDRGGGVASLSAEVDGAIVATSAFDANGGRCVAPYVYRVPCKLSGAGTIGVDTTALPDGRHRLRILARDAAGNVSAAGPYDVTVRNTPVSCATGTNGAITAGLPRKRTRMQKRARATRIRGRAPAGAELQLVARVARRGDVAKPVGKGARAGADGRYSLRVPKGPSRTLRVGWRRPGEPDFSCSRRLSLKVRARVSLRGSKSVPAGRPRATFRGRLIGGYVPRRGKLVLLQGKQAGRSWRTFRAVRTNRQGGFTTRYRFSGARGLFRVRARVPGEAAYPFEPASGRQIRVRVR